MIKRKNIKYIKRKLQSSFSKPIVKSIRLVSFNPDSKPVGSFAYKTQRYPGDIDINEDIKSCCGLKESVKKISNRLIEFAFRLSQQSFYYFADFKAGIDYRFYVQINKDLPNLINEWYNESLLTKNEHINMINAIKENNLEELKELIRNKYTVRWSLNDLLRGYTILPGNKQLNLEDAIQDKIIIKLDIWAPINNRYIEVTNFIVLYYIDENGKQYVLSGERPEYIKGVKDDIKLYLSESNLNVFKATKRIWLLANEFKDVKMLSRINRIINSDAGIMYQVISDIKTLIDMYKKINNLPYDFINNEIDDFRNRLSYVYNINFNEKYIDDQIINLINNLFSRENIIQILEEIEDHLLTRLNAYTLDYDLKTGILPIKGKYI